MDQSLSSTMKSNKSKMKMLANKTQDKLRSKSKDVIRETSQDSYEISSNEIDRE